MSIYYVGVFPYSDDLYHHGTKGQKWGVRKYQNIDGSLTQAGKDRYLRGYDLDADKTNQNGRSNQISISSVPISKASSGKQFAESTLISITVDSKPGSQASTVANGKESAYKMFGNFKVLKETNGVTSEAIRKALDEKRAKEKAGSKAKTESPNTTTETAETKITEKKTKSKKKASSTKSATKKKTSAKKSSSRKSSKKSSASSKTATNTVSVSRSRNRVSVGHLETAGTSAAKRAVDDLLKAYRVKTR